MDMCLDVRLYLWYQHVHAHLHIHLRRQMCRRDVYSMDMAICICRTYACASACACLHICLHIFPPQMRPTTIGSAPVLVQRDLLHERDHKAKELDNVPMTIITR